MASSFPTSVDTFSAPGATLASPAHDAMHIKVHDALTAIETTVNDYTPNPQNLKWDDMRMDLNRSSTGGGSAPSSTSFRDGIFLYAFSKTIMQQLSGDMQLPHGYAAGTSIYPHIHWSPGASTQTGVVRWGLEYSWANINSAFGATTTVYVEQAGPGVAYTHKIASWAAIDGTGKSKSSVLLLRVFRDAAHANDTFDDVAFGVSFDLHFQIEAVGSTTEIPT